MKKFFLLSCLFLLLLSVYSVASDERISTGANILESILSESSTQNYLIKYRNDGRFVGVLYLNKDKDNIGHIIRVFNTHTQEQVFEFKDEDKKVVSFVFKKDAIVIYYKSAFWEERTAYDLYTGRVVRRYSSWFGYS